MNTIKSYVMYKVTSPAKQGTSISHHYLLTTSSTTISIHAERTSISQVGFALIFDAMFIKCLLQFRGHTALATVSQKANLFSWINTAQQEGIQGLSKSVVCSIYKSSVFMGCNHSPEWRWPKAWVPLSAARAPAAALVLCWAGYGLVKWLGKRDKEKSVIKLSATFLRQLRCSYPFSLTMKKYRICIMKILKMSFWIARFTPREKESIIPFD